MTELSPESILAHITTRWSQVTNPVQFVAKYARAIQAYFRALIRHPQEAEDAAQDFLAKVVSKGFSNVTLTHGRFRDYLAVAVKNSAINHLKQQQKRKVDSLTESDVFDPHDAFKAADDEWLQQWHQCIVDTAWRKLHHLERKTPGNLYHTVLRARTVSHDQTDATVAMQLTQTLGREISAVAFRKTLSRARKTFGEFLIEEVAQTINDPTPERVEEELIATGLMTYVSSYLNSAWRAQGLLDDPPES